MRTKTDYMWRIGSGNDNTIITYDARTLDFGVNNWVGDLTTAMYNDYMSGDMTVAPFVWGRIGSSITTGAQTGILELTNIRRHAGGTFDDNEALTLWDGATREWDDAAQVTSNELARLILIPTEQRCFLSAAVTVSITLREGLSLLLMC
jgi:hypothetical protein